jgi:GNAT superfamily N-acetyltransferase
MLVTFRPCRPKDHATLLRFVVEYYHFDKIPFNRASLSQGLDTLLRNVSQGQAWLMESHKKPVGYAVVTYNFDLEYGGVESILTDLYVSKRYRNRGIGSLALYEIEDFCRERGVRNIELQLESQRARRGFLPKGRISDSTSQGNAAWGASGKWLANGACKS